ncbi:MAG: oligosaccharide flippase family protein [Psychroflexus maritimus]
MFKKLFQQTFIYGLSTVLPRLISVLLLPLYTGILENSNFGDYSLIFAYFVIFNVVLSYGMETAFFRFYNKEENPEQVIHTSHWSISLSTLIFVVLGFVFLEPIHQFTRIETPILKLVIGILALDALAVIPFAWLRAKGKPIKYAVIKTLNVSLNLGLNIFFLLYLKDWSKKFSVLESIYIEDYEVNYIFISLFISSALTLLLLVEFFKQVEFQFNKQLWKRMMNYALPVLVAGLAYSINEVLDRILLERLLPQDIAKEQVGIYSACYKLGMFMTLFGTAFRLGVEPFFFSHAKSVNPTKAYAIITKYYSILGGLILLVVLVFADLFKVILIRDESYYEAMDIVPVILLANLFLGLYHNLSVWYKVTDRTKFGAYISSLGAIVTVVINLTLIPVYGYYASAGATLLAYFLMMILSYFFGQKYYKIPYSTSKISLYLLVAVGFSALAFYGFRENYAVGTLLILIFATIIYFGEKAELIQLLKPSNNQNSDETRT